MLAVPVGRFGFGAIVQGPYVRGGSGDETSQAAIFSIASTIRLIEADLVGAWRASDLLTVGVGLRIGQFAYASDRLIDTGATLNQALDLQPPFEVGEPLLAGRQTVGPMTGWSASWTAGVTLTLPQGTSVHAYGRPTWRQRATGDVALVPSNDLDAVVEGQVAIELPLPAHVGAAARIPLGERWRLMPQLEWAGWRQAGTNVADISGLSLTSDDPLLDGVLGAADTEDFLAASEGVDASDLQWRNTLEAGIQAEVDVSRATTLRGGVGYAPQAVRDTWVSPSNVDFGGAWLRAAVAWTAPSASSKGPAIRLGLSTSAVVTSPRVIRDSPLSLADPPAGAPLVPSGNGRYALLLGRLGLTAQVVL